jgi:hypothetical protein
MCKHGSFRLLSHVIRQVMEIREEPIRIELVFDHIACMDCGQEFTFAEYPGKTSFNIIPKTDPKGLQI